MDRRIILITGANSGVGLATAKVLACASDSFHIIMAGRSLGRVQTTMSELQAQPYIKGTLSVVQLEVTDETSIATAANYVRQEFGRLDVLINNAGVSGLDLGIKTSFQRCMETNVMGPALVSEAFRPLLLNSRNPYSIFVGSGARTLTRNAAELSVGHEHVARRSGGAYQVSKAAMNMLALVEYRDFKSQGLKVFVVSPGFVRSNLRGTSEEARSGWGKAGDPDTAGEIMLDIVQGKRDADSGKYVHKDGTYDW
ncbi:short chain dehydrogenase/reductase [Xylariales sp. PMI_506]|nr:short chain dehydrogenase/reductase [Xylariales sp. PMI_506]